MYKELVYNEEEFNDFCRSDDKENWVPKKLKELFKKKEK